MADLPAVARLFLRIFRGETGDAPEELLNYLEQHYLTGPFACADIPPLVHVDNERVTGFVGVNTLPMRLGDRRLRVAVCGALMVENPAADPMAGARLLRVFLSGPQDLSISETANDISVALWRRLGGAVLAQYSLDWLRILRPAGFVVDRAASRLPVFGLFRSLAGGFDRLFTNHPGKSGPRWSSLGRNVELPRGLSVDLIETQAFAAAFDQLTRHIRLRPDFKAAELDHAVAEAASIRRRGEARAVAVRTMQGEMIGAAFYYLRPKGLATVLQVVAADGRIPPVLDALLSHLHQAGAVGVIGRSQPILVDTMLERRVAFLPFAATVAHARDAEVMAAIRAGDAFLNGFIGENWSRLVEGQFE